MKRMLSMLLILGMMFSSGICAYAYNTEGVVKCKAPLSATEPMFILVNNTNNTYTLQEDDDYDSVILYAIDGMQWTQQIKFSPGSTLLLRSNKSRTFPIQMWNQSSKNLLAEVALWPTSTSASCSSWDYLNAMQNISISMQPIYNNSGKESKIACTGMLVTLNSIK